MKVIYIAGLYHSGSTLLDMVLGNLPNFVGLGEVFLTLKGEFKDRCTCNQPIEKCEFWGDVIKKLQEEPNLDPQSKYSLIISHFKDKYGPEKILIDSSLCRPFKIISGRDERGMSGLNFLVNIPNIDIKVIHLVRDVRSWTNSLLLRDAKTTKDLRLSKRIFRYFFKSAFVRFIQWYWGHRGIIRYLKENDLDHFRISYEDLAIDSENTLKNLCEFLDTEYDKSLLIPSGTKSHIASGNFLKNYDMQKIKYDYRWLSSSRLLLPALILRPVMKFNNKILYGNK